MTSIRDIPIEDIKSFLYLNDFDMEQDDDIYNVVLDIVLNEEVEYYPDNIIDWMIAYNNKLLNINVKYYSESEIYKLPEDKLFILSKKLNVNSNLIKSIINVLYYMSRLKKEIFIELGQHLVSDVLIKLQLQIIIHENIVNMKISLPENYPQTEIGEHYYIKLKGLIYADLELVTPRNKSWKYYLAEEVNKIFKIKSKKALLLKDFRNIAVTEELSLVDDEIIINKGLGKKILCIGIPYIIEHFKLDPDDTLILLDAQGGIVRKQDEIKMNEYLTKGREFMLNLYEEKYPEDFSMMNPFLKHEEDYELCEYLMSLENNEKLINYYVNSLGLIQLTNISKSVSMGTKLSEMMKSCK